MATTKKPKPCYSCEHVHPVGQECRKRTPAQHSSFAPICDCREGR